MRKAFLCALGAWGIVGVAIPFGSGSARVAAQTLVLALTALWLAHISAASVRVTRFLVSEQFKKQQDHQITNEPWSRRKLIINFSRVFGLTALISVAPGPPALAQGCECPDDQKPGYNVYLKQCFCCPANNTVCYDETSNWCCLKAGCDC
jgi:hypothetical protein